MIICVAARMKSKRCPGKAMADLHGKPLILRLFERLPHEIPAILCTSTNKQDDILAETCEQAGIEVYRGSEDDVMERFLAVAKEKESQHVIRVTGDNPLTDPVWMRRMIVEHLRECPDYTRASGMPAGTKCEIVNVEALQSLHDHLLQNQAKVDTEYMTYDLLTLNKILEVPNPLDKESHSFTVDYPEQLGEMQAIYDYYQGIPPALEDIIGAGFGA